MTSVTFVEPLDEHMLEYPADTDIPMYSGASTSGYWMPQEATMDDDIRPTTLDPHPGHTEVIEVDMEHNDYDEEMAEYDMADGVFTHDTGDYLDVEVVDSSPSFSPAMVPVTETTDVSQVLVAPLDASTATPEPLPHPIPYYEHVAEVQEVSHEPHVAPDEPHYHHHSHTVPLPEVRDFTSLSAQQDAPLAPVDAAEPSLDASIPPATTEAVMVHPPSDDQAADATFGQPVPATPGHTVHGLPDEGANAPDPSNLTNEPAAISEDVVHHPDDAEPTHHDQPADHHSLDEDPLEISEGVYIDPPPAVSLVISSEEQEFLLFNNSRPQTSTSVDVASMGKDQAHVLLLHDRPTLYYEPLNNVFTALRQEDVISKNPELYHGEIVLDAFDLQLVISEDNAHTSEVTIHELNVLHDVAGMHGPLRLRLYALTPRFITRYNALREQLTRLQTSSDDNQGEDKDRDREEVHEAEAALGAETEEDQFSEDRSGTLSTEAQENQEEGDDEAPLPTREAEAYEGVAQDQVAEAPGEDEQVPDHSLTVPQESHDDHIEVPAQEIVDRPEIPDLRSDEGEPAAEAVTHVGQGVDLPDSQEDEESGTTDWDDYDDNAGDDTGDLDEGQYIEALAEQEESEEQVSLDTLHGAGQHTDESKEEDPVGPDVEPDSTVVPVHEVENLEDEYETYDDDAEHESESAGTHEQELDDSAVPAEPLDTEEIGGTAPDGEVTVDDPHEVGTDATQPELSTPHPELLEPIDSAEVQHPLADQDSFSPQGIPTSTKRSHDQVESDFEDGPSPPGSPGSKRLRAD